MTMMIYILGAYINNGAQLRWLIDPDERRLEVYRNGQPVEILEDPLTLSG